MEGPSLKMRFEGELSEIARYRVIPEQEYAMR